MDVAAVQVPSFFPGTSQSRYQVLKDVNHHPLLSHNAHLQRFSQLLTTIQLDEVDIMPNISFDIFFQDDIINITASRSAGSAPKVKPAWKVRTAPKLPPKEPPVPKTVAAFGPPKAKQITEAKPAAKKEEKPAAKPKEAAKPSAEPKKPTEVKKAPKLKDAKAGAKPAST